VAAFRATLEEISEADLLIHVVDITHPNAMAQWKSVQQTLVDINANQIPMITALNKIYTLPDPLAARQAVAEFSNSVAISALTGQGIPDLLMAIESTMFETYVNLKVRIPYQQGQLISIFLVQGQVDHVEHGRGGVLIHGLLPGRLMARFKPYVVDNKAPKEKST
jgi:GTP-binding protein HflX